MDRVAVNFPLFVVKNTAADRRISRREGVQYSGIFFKETVIKHSVSDVLHQQMKFYFFAPRGRYARVYLPFSLKIRMARKKKRKTH